MLVSVTVLVLAGSVIVFVSVRVIAPPPELVLDAVVAAVAASAGPVAATTEATATASRARRRTRRDVTGRLSRLF